MLIKMEQMSRTTESIKRYWIDIYVLTIAGLGVILFIASIGRLSSDWLGIGLLTLLAGISELSSVELFKSSRNSRVSMSSIVAIAGIMVYGPYAGILVHGFSGLITMLPNTFLTDLPKKGRESMVKRGLFNMGMFVVSAFLAGQTYLHLGGQFNSVITFSNLLPLVGAAAIDTFANVGLLIGVLILQTGKPAGEIWKQNFQWSVPISILGGIVGGGALAIANELAGLWGEIIFFLPVLSIGYSFRVYATNSRDFINQLERLNLELKNTNERLENNNQELMETLGAVVDAYDVYTYGHSASVSDFALDIAHELGLSSSKVKLIEQAGLLHDIGKVGITDAIIQKPGPLTEAEFDVVKTHPSIGAEIVSRMSGLQPLAPIILHHHEHWDGKGYPDGLAGEEIPFESRILALADTLDTMCSDRPYRAARSPEYIIQEVRKCSGSQFDPQIVQAFDRIIERKGHAFFDTSRIKIKISDKKERINRIGLKSRRKSTFPSAISQSPTGGK